MVEYAIANKSTVLIMVYFLPFSHTAQVPAEVGRDRVNENSLVGASKI